MKISPNNRWIASASGGTGTDAATVELLAFNSYAGTMDSAITLIKRDVLPNAYSVEFSPLNSKLYVCESDGRQIVQFDLSSDVMSRIPKTATFIVSTELVNVLQLGPDGKIYVTGRPRCVLDVIHLPELTAVNVNYQRNYLTLNGGSNAELGLPNFAPVLGRKYPISFKINANACASSPSGFYLTGLPPANNYIYHWDFGDTTYSSDRKPMHQYNRLGNFQNKSNHY